MQGQPLLNTHENHAALADIGNANVVITQSDVILCPTSGAVNAKIKIHKPMGFEIDLFSLPFQCQRTLGFSDISIVTNAPILSALFAISDTLNPIWNCQKTENYIFQTMQTTI